MVDKKCKFATSKKHQTGHERCWILKDAVCREKRNDAGLVPSKQMSIATFIPSPPTLKVSNDSNRVALADIKDDVETVQNSHEPVSSENIPAAFLATQAFASPRDFFVTPRVQGSGTSDGPSVSMKETYVVCTLCRVTMGKRECTLERHLYRHHPHVFRVDTSIKTEELSSRTNKHSVMEQDVESGTGTDQLMVQSCHSFGRGTKSDKMSDSVDPNSQKLNDAFESWLCSDVIPVKALQSELFHEFVSLVNPRFKMPEVNLQPRLRSTLDTNTDATLTNVVKVDATQVRLMKGLCLQGNGGAPQLKTDLLVPSPGPQEALIEVLRAGICGTDLQMIHNYKAGFKGALGHEFVGIVRQLGTQGTIDEQFWIGKRVVGEINIPCDASHCTTCSIECKEKRDRLSRNAIRRRNHCPNRSCLGIVRKDGAFAEYITLPVANLYEVPHEIVDSHAVFAEPLAAACRILEQQIIHSSDHVVILGDGKLGLMVAEVLHAFHAAKSITLVGKHREKLALATSFVTSVYTLANDDEAEMAKVAACIKKERAPIDVCIDSTGTSRGVALALEIVRNGGAVVIKSTCSAKRSTLDVRAFQTKRLRIIGSRCGPIPWALQLLKERKVDVQKYLHGVYPLERAEEALAHAAQRGTLKIQLVIR